MRVFWALREGARDPGTSAGPRSLLLLIKKGARLCLCSMQKAAQPGSGSGCWHLQAMRASHHWPAQQLRALHKHSCPDLELKEHPQAVQCERGPLSAGAHADAHARALT